MYVAHAYMFITCIRARPTATLAAVIMPDDAESVLPSMFIYETPIYWALPSVVVALWSKLQTVLLAKVKNERRRNLRQI